MDETRAIRNRSDDDRPSRRDVLAWSAAAILAMHGIGSSTARGQTSPDRSPDDRRGSPTRQPRIRRLRLKTHVLPELRRFWGETIGFHVAAETRDSVAFDAGTTRLEFESVTDSSQPFYHFAFNIPENKLDKAKEWLGKRATILRDARNGSDVVFFEQWNAHSVFFYDPAGNLGELIGRHTLPNAAQGPFGLGDVLYASEIGFVPPDQPRTFAKIREGLGIAPYLNSTSFLGDEWGLLIVIPKDVRWIPEFKKTGILCPTQVTVAGHGARKIPFDGLPFEIDSIES